MEKMEGVDEMDDVGNKFEAMEKIQNISEKRKKGPGYVGSW